MIAIHWQITIHLTCLVVFCFCLYVLFCFVFFCCYKYSQQGRETRSEEKSVVGQRKLTSKTKGNVYFKRSTNSWAFLCDRLLGLCLFPSGRWTIAYSFSQKLTVLLTRSARAFHIFMVNFFIFSLSFCWSIIQPTPTSINFPFSFRLIKVFEVDIPNNKRLAAEQPLR